MAIIILLYHQDITCKKGGKMDEIIWTDRSL